MISNERKLLDRMHFDKRLKFLENKFKNKTIVVYETGPLFDTIVDDYNLDKLDIIAISDARFEESDITEYKGYKAVSPLKIKELNPDIVLVCAPQSLASIEYLRYQLLVDTDIKVLPLVKRSLISTIKEIWK